MTIAPDVRSAGVSRWPMPIVGSPPESRYSSVFKPSHSLNKFKPRWSTCIAILRLPLRCCRLGRVTRVRAASLPGRSAPGLVLDRPRAHVALLRPVQPFSQLLDPLTGSLGHERARAH